MIKTIEITYEEKFRKKGNLKYFRRQNKNKYSLLKMNNKIVYHKKL